MLLWAVTVLTTLQLVASYVHHVERRGTVCVLPDGSSRTVGETFTIGDSKCIKYECRQDGSAPFYYAGCQKPDGSCVDVNDTYNDGCSLKRCTFLNGKIGFTGDKCSDTEIGGCKTVGDVWEVKRHYDLMPEYGQCITKRCEEGGSNNITKTACLHGDTCFDVGTFIIKKDPCRKIECVYNAEQDKYIMMPFTICKAGNLTAAWCVDLGSEGFPLVIGGTLYDDCMCEKNGNEIKYECYEA